MAKVLHYRKNGFEELLIKKVKRVKKIKKSECLIISDTESFGSNEKTKNTICKSDSDISINKKINDIIGDDLDDNKSQMISKILND